ncbi:uncharacterized protein LOC120160098 [Hibiscus syriacus]|uniref:uncharacterized protein LOC120160098 n=1 Tax=Hibiscus syriacus TaxID=106335 RepID=UPI001920716F|nr:uncharacterized protein LOC120160098 [Hibiscus syriacus]
MRARGRGRGKIQSESTAQTEVRSTARMYNLKTSEDCDDLEIITGSNYSYVSSILVKDLNLSLEPIHSEMIVMNPLRNSTRVILGMDWIYHYYANMDCLLKRVQLTSLEGLEISVVNERIHPLANVISLMSAWKLMLQGCQAYISNVIDTRVKERKLEDIPTVGEFLEVFSDDLPGLRPDREVEFQIEVMSESAPISMAPYRMALKELKELKTRL